MESPGQGIRNGVIPAPKGRSFRNRLKAPVRNQLSLVRGRIVLSRSETFDAVRFALQHFLPEWANHGIVLAQKVGGGLRWVYHYPPARCLLAGSLGRPVATPGS